ncbi:MAG: UvrD-helicase domain-containing protein [Treponema sp.]|jgi:DNA helicase-2/ATP-dependent DNA helicase PcrA|nr:UvrD-helicase domain-containing protein [Treponema sp.]
MSRLNLAAELNEPQITAVTTVEGPLLIIAGAGSGKTRVITWRIANMLEKGIPQHAILALTFTNKAAREMETRVKEITGKKLQSLTVSTFHAFGLGMLREEAEQIGRRKNFSVYDETDKLSLIRECLRECRLYSDKINLYTLGSLFSSVKTGRSGWEDDSVWEPVYREYQESLKIYNALDFDDLLVLPIDLFENSPGILEKYRRRYRYIMVDEFQDTSLIQYRLMKLLACGNGGSLDAEKPGETEAPNICVVGDDDQSIYSWRGASYENILMFEKDFPSLLEIKLEQNYRSTTTILEAANGVIANNANRKDKRLWSGNTGGKPIELFFPADDGEEAAFIASRIRSLMARENLKYHDFAVLVRTNSLTRNIEEAFLAENLPYRVSGGTSFFQRKEIRDVISYLRVIANPDDDVNLLRIINTPRRGIGKTAVARLSALARGGRSSIWGALVRARAAGDESQKQLFEERRAAADSEDFTGLVDAFRDEILGRKAAGGGKWTLSASVRSLVDRIDYWSCLVTEHSKNEKLARWKFSNIEYFIKMIESWERDPDNLDAGLYPYLNRISLITGGDREENAEGKVSLMTIHASKGLEFPVVFIAGAEDGIIPHEKSLEEEAGNIEEERRLFYVAITRARDKLYITSCKKRKRVQNTVECSPSPFLEEIPGRLVRPFEEDKILSEAEAGALFAKMREKFTAGVP